MLSGSHAVTGLVASMALEFLVGASVVYGDVSSPDVSSPVMSAVLRRTHHQLSLMLVMVLSVILKNSPSKTHY